MGVVGREVVGVCGGPRLKPGHDGLGGPAVACVVGDVRVEIEHGVGGHGGGILRVEGCPDSEHPDSAALQEGLVHGSLEGGVGAEAHRDEGDLAAPAHHQACDGEVLQAW